jgi:hypothetical protein
LVPTDKLATSSPSYRSLGSVSTLTKEFFFPPTNEFLLQNALLFAEEIFPLDNLTSGYNFKNSENPLKLFLDITNIPCLD